jgi:flagellin
LSGFDLKVGGVGALSNASTWDLSASAATAQTVASELDTAIVTVNSNLATMGAQAKALSVQKEFLTKLSDQIENNIGQLVDADLAKESARLQALQIKQQLGAQALSIANQQPSILLSFFRG